MRERKYVKLRVDMYEDTKFKIIDTMDERDLIHYIWTRIVTLAGKVNLEGDLYMSKNIPYTAETLSIEFNRSVEKVELALNVLKDLEMVEFTEDNVYKVRNFTKHQNIKVKEKTENVGNKVEVNNKESIVNEELENQNFEKNEKESKDNNENNLKNNCTKHNKINVNIKAKEVKCEEKLDNEIKIIELKKNQSENNSLNNKNIYDKEKLDNNINLDSNLLLDMKINKRKSKNGKKKEKYNNDIIKIDDEECMIDVCEWRDQPKLEGDTLIKSFIF
ncbi:phage replisome organizer N-terminal domain-containing protein [Clostridium uliginosum]|uniref:Phage replisome organizer, putative, N-terminal region n=1 Tax=Clostridium uliginosum TaxID=119641 RepID=A0A1I1JPW5_9CLOT|nr:phage replisome organizer N-terminal domain-containing protein [Clostridium uliginosum]SFC50604.1 phage replisome organizer, putative, N-terminal region [Clostridium uliginosum]